MNNLPEDNVPVPKTKRQSYKRYIYHGSVAPIPTSTKRNWKVKRQALISEDSLPEHQSTDDEYDEDISPYEEETNVGIKKNSDAEPQHFDGTNDGDIQDAIISMETESENAVSSNGSTSSETEDDVGHTQQEATDTAKEYDKNLLVKALLILATKLHHNLTYAAAQDIVQLMSVLGNFEPTQATKYFWKKLVDDFSSWMTIHYTCNECGAYVGVKTNEVLRCSVCDAVVDCSQNLNNAFLYISLTHQLKQIFELTRIHESIGNTRQKNRACAIEDIVDGKLYKMKVKTREGMISVNFSVDGVPVFDSSNFSIYPLLCTVNELKPDQRKDHVLLCGLWFGQGKPKMNEYLKPFVAEAKILYDEGFTYTYEGAECTRKCCILVGVCDSVARPMVRNSTQFNGAYGCGLCLHPGETIAKGRGHTRVYPIDANKNAFGEGLRTHEQSLLHAEIGEKGFRSRSILCDIPEFDIVSSLDVDWMHAVALGVCRQFAKLWFDSAYHDKQFYFGHHTENVDKLLLSFRPTIEVSRTPRRMSDRSHWKAHEWVIFLLFYSLPILLVLFPKKYVEHWALLVDGIQILSKTSIMKSEILYAHNSLLQFVDGVERLYGREHVSFNVHLLAHLSQSVENWGPLWSHSAFIYENANQALLNYVKSSNGVAKQICDTFRAKCVVDRLIYTCSEDMTSDQKTYLNQLRAKRVKPKAKLIINGITSMLGAVTTYNGISREHQLAFERANIVITDESKITSYERATVNGEVVHSKAYTRVEKRCNYYVQLNDNAVFEIHLFYVLTSDTTTCYALGKYFCDKKNNFFKDRRLEHLIVFQERSDSFAVINTDTIQEKVIMLHPEELRVWIACVHPNHYELLT